MLKELFVAHRNRVVNWNISGARSVLAATAAAVG